MDLSQDDIDVLDRYYRDEITDAELKQLRERMKDAGFAEAVRLYLESLNIVKQAGRVELRSLLASVKSDIDSSGKYDEYKPSAPGKGSGSSGMFTAMIAVIIGITAYLFYSQRRSKEEQQKDIPSATYIDSINNSSHPDREIETKSGTIVRTDTIYHYQIVRDTIYVNPDSLDDAAIHRVSSDTVFTRKYIRKPVDSISE
jgi:hypothetical protein